MSAYSINFSNNNKRHYFVYPWEVINPQGVLYKVLYREALARDLTPYFLYINLTEKVPLFLYL